MATIQTTQLEERETGDIKQLRDHDIAEGPVSTNSADATSLKSVPLTLEDGSIIKVRFDSLVTAIGQALGASEDSTVTKVLGLNGTVPKGIGMANLASVLGGVGVGGLKVRYNSGYNVRSDTPTSYGIIIDGSCYDNTSFRSICLYFGYIETTVIGFWYNVNESGCVQAK